MHGGKLQRLGHHFKDALRCCHPRVNKSSGFNIKNIVKQNETKTSFVKTKDLKSIKNPAKIESKGTVDDCPEEKDQRICEETNASRHKLNEHISNVTEELDPPDCFTVLLDTPLVGSHDDVSKQYEFKSYIEEIDVKSIPSVGKIMKATEPKSQQDVLERWKKAKTEELGGEKQFEAYQKKTLNTGLGLHKSIELYLRGEKEVQVSEKHAAYWESVLPILGDVSDVKLLETDIVHSDMFYSGKFDCIALLRNKLCLIEWKTSSKPKPLLSGTYDVPLQVVAYMGAVNRSGILKQCDISAVTSGALVFAYPTGEKADVHIMNTRQCDKYWRKWQERVFLYWAQQYRQHQGYDGALD